MNKKAKSHSKSDNTENDEFCLYSLLNIPKTASEQDIKKAYRALALKFHPDKNPEAPEEARTNFQKVTKAYEILSNPEKKILYDETGIVDAENSAEFQNAYEYFRQIYKKFEEKDISDFSAKYRGGKMEEEDLINFYNESKGDIKLILESIPLSLNEDLPRFIKFYEDKIQQEELKSYPKFESSKKNVKLLKDETKEHNKNMKKKNKKDDINELTLMIANKHQNRMGFLDVLESKYGGKKGENDIDDEEFDRIQKNFDAKKKKKH